MKFKNLESITSTSGKDILKNSYILAWISQFGPIFDYHLTHHELPSNKHIVYLDDEIFEFANIYLPLEEKTLPENLCDPRHVYICKIKWVSDFLTRKGCKNILFPWGMIIDQCISLHLLKDQFVFNYPTHKNKAYFCLNRCDRPHRRLFVEYLNERSLLTKGKVTYRENPPDIDDIYSGDDISHYNSGNIGFERHQKKINQTWFSPIVDNFVKVNQHYTQPINISIETGTYDFFPTEKSMLAFITKRLPLIYAAQNRMETLRKEGFDLFDWVLDHSYDSINDSEKRGKNLIDFNYDILTNTIKIDNKIKKSLDYNYEYLINDWLDKTLGNLQESIEKLI